MHVAQYVWAAAHAFYKLGTIEAEAWAADHLTSPLADQADRAAAEMTAKTQQAHLPAARREAVDTCRRYLTGHLAQLRYDTALENGWPIATGAVEWACRHLIGDHSTSPAPAGDSTAPKLSPTPCPDRRRPLRRLLALTYRPRAQTPLSHL